MTWLDLAIIMIIFLSALISTFRGFIKESVSLVTWIVAGIISFRYFAALSNSLEPYLSAPSLRGILSFSILFILTLIAGAICNFALTQLVTKTGLSGTDKSLGVIFGAARGFLIVTFMVLLLGLTPTPGTELWDDSVTIEFFEDMAEWVREIIPDDVADDFEFDF